MNLVMIETNTRIKIAAIEIDYFKLALTATVEVIYQPLKDLFAIIKPFYYKNKYLLVFLLKIINFVQNN